MKKIMLFLALLFTASLSHAVATEVFGTLVRGTLLDHVTYAVQAVDGETKGVFVDSIVLIGSHNGRSIFDIQAGFAGDARPDSSEEKGIKWITGGFLKVSSLIRDTVHLADQWKFLNSLEYGVKYEYDWTEKRDYVGAQIGLAFTLQPKE